MPVEFQLEIEKRRLRVRWIGPVSGHAMLEADIEFREKPQTGFEADFDQLIDMRAATIGDIPTETLQVLTSKPPAFARSSRRALVVPSDLGYGLSRMWEQMRTDEAGDIRVFRDIDEAERWLDERVRGAG